MFNVIIPSLASKFLLFAIFYIIYRFAEILITLTCRITILPIEIISCILRKCKIIEM